MGESTVVAEDTIVHVDREYFPSCLASIGKPIHHTMWRTGPVEYDLAKLTPWLHRDQRSGQVLTSAIYKAQLEGKDSGCLRRCLNLQDALAIQQKGIGVYRQFFGGKSLLLWKAVVEHPSKRLLIVPSLSEHGDQLLVSWLWFEFALGPNAITPHLPVW